MKFFNKENKKVNNAESRKVTLEVNGLSADSFISLKLANGQTLTVSGNGIKELSADELADALKNAVGGNINNDNLHRRWVMAQWFRQYNHPKGYAYAVSQLTQAYQWKMLDKELETLAKLERKDPEYFAERTVFFNITNITEMLSEYEQDLKNRVEHSKIHHCHGVPYIKLAGNNIFTADIPKKIYRNLEIAIIEFSKSGNYNTALQRYRRIKNTYLLKYRTDKKTAGKVFLEAYKASGAYYTLQNMVQCHDCSLREFDLENVRFNDRIYTGKAAYLYMKSLLPVYASESYRWTGMLRQCIKDNNFKFAV